ncbi:MAG: hypothetical protein KJ065_00135 [Anaerolineae bacterium]|nr:hypothetical protein [Anaerolineae bacterium]
MVLTFDSNTIYLILFIGLWIGVTATYVPGTGVIELISIGVVLFGIYLLTTVTVNWWALILLILGVAGFLAVPFIKGRPTLIAGLGLALQAIGSLFLFSQNPVSPVLVATCIGIVLLYHQLALRPALERNRTRSIIDEEENLIGARGRVIKSFSPVGAVHVRGESWSAQSDHPLDMGEEVVVVERDGLTLFVEAVKHKNEELS